MKHLYWMGLAAALGTFACGGGEGEGEPGPIASAKLLSANGTFSTTAGELEVVMAPLDADGRFSARELALEACSFEGVFITPVDRMEERLPMRTHATDVEIDESAERAVVRGASAYGLVSGEGLHQVSGAVVVTLESNRDSIRTPFSFETTVVE